MLQRAAEPLLFIFLFSGDVEQAFDSYTWGTLAAGMVAEPSAEASARC